MVYNIFNKTKLHTLQILQKLIYKKERTITYLAGEKLEMANIF